MDENLEQHVEQPQANPVEEQARALGWRPQEEFEGDPNQFRSAKEFIERGELIGKIRAQTKQIQNIEQALQHVTKQNTRVFAAGYDEAVRDLKVRRKLALSEGDLLAADDLADKINETELEKRRALTAAQAPTRNISQSEEDPDHAPWVAANPWYNDGDNAVAADAIAAKFIRENQGQVTPQQVRVHVSKTFKEKFLKQTTGAPSPDGDGRSNRGNNAVQRFSKVQAGMSEDETRIMNTIIRSTGMTKEMYLKQYSEAR